VSDDPLPRFRLRSESVSRLEGFSDTAFGFAITLLVVSLAVPSRFDQLLQQLRGLPVFAVTFALVATIWYAQYVFFRRYALSDVLTVVLTLLLLFVVLFYVYPLKFLFGVPFQVGGVSIQEGDVPFLFLIYRLGFASVSLVLALLYIHAYQKSVELRLSEWGSGWSPPASPRSSLRPTRRPSPGSPASGSRWSSPWRAGPVAAGPARS
jgi:hypothetical protein